MYDVMIMHVLCCNGSRLHCYNNGALGNGFEPPWGFSSEANHDGAYIIDMDLMGGRRQLDFGCIGGT